MPPPTPVSGPSLGPSGFVKIKETLWKPSGNPLDLNTIFSPFNSITDHLINPHIVVLGA